MSQRSQQTQIYLNIAQTSVKWVTGKVGQEKSRLNLMPQDLSDNQMPQNISHQD